MSNKKPGTKPEIKSLAMRVSGGGLPKDYSIVLNVEFDFTGCTRDELIGWALGDRRVALQRWLRNKSPEYLETLKQDGFRVHARDAGSAQKTREDKIRDLEAMGIKHELAAKIVDNPEAAEKLMTTDK